jgi:hypothetical protein
MAKSINLDFLNQERVGKEEFEVTDYSIRIMKSQYEYLKEHYTPVMYSKNRRQMSSEGAYLKANSPKRIDVVGDIMTSEKFMGNIHMIDANLRDMYLYVYHSIGNIIPIPEGANYGGGPGSDNYYYKLGLIKDWLDEKKDNRLISLREKNIVDGRINENLYLSSPAKGDGFPPFTKRLIHRYWINSETDFKDWPSYIQANYLEDFVDKNNNLIPFNYKEPDLEMLIKMIIKRSYRIVNKYELKDDKDIENILNLLKSQM